VSRINVTSKNQSGGTTANRIDSPDIDIKSKVFITRQRAEGFVTGILVAVIAGVIVELIKAWFSNGR